MKFRRWLALLVTTALALTLLTGCGASLPHPSTWTIENGTLYVPYGARTLTREQVEQVGRPFTGVALPATLREIGEGAFEGNTQLQRVQFGTEQADSPVNSSTGWIDLTGSGVALAGLFWDGGLTIGERAFYNCGSLSQVTGWGSSVSIGAYSFRGTNIYGSTDLSNVVYIGEYAFEDCWGITGQVSLHKAAYIGENAFAGCTGITGGLDLSSATTIGAGAFSGCTGLSGKIVMDKVETIGANAFEGCTGVTSVQYSQKAEVAENAFSGVSAVINGTPVAGGGSSSGGSSGGGGGGSAPAVLTELTVDAGSARTEYFVGETFDPTGLTLTAHYSNGTTQPVNIDDVTWTPAGELTADTTKITLTYQDKTAEVPVTVQKVEIDELVVSEGPTKTVYFVGDTFSIAGLTLTATYNNNDTNTIAIESGDDAEAKGVTWSTNGNFNTAGEKTITVSYQGKSQTFTVTVKEPKVVSIALSGWPEDKTFVVGQSFDPTGLTLTATYDDPKKENDEITITSAEQAKQLGVGWTPQGALNISTTQVTLTYQGQTATVEVQVVPVAVSEIQVSQNPTKTSYVVGQSFDPAGMKLTVTKNDNSQETITITDSSDANQEGVSWEPEDGFTETGKQTVTISYEGKTTEIKVDVIARALVSISAAYDSPGKTYYEGDKFDPNGLTVTAHYNDGTSAQVTEGYTYSNEPLAAGQQTVTISYTYNGVTKTTSVSVTVKAKTITGLQAFINQIEEAKKGNPNADLCDVTIKLGPDYAPDSEVDVVSTFLSLLGGENSGIDSTNSTASGADGNLTGTLDCGGATVVLTGSSPLIKTINSGATLSNLNIRIESSNIKSSGKCGAAAEKNYGAITDCTVTVNGSSITATGATGYAGGIVGYNYSSGTITGCTVTMKGSRIDSEDCSGGIAGVNQGTITDCDVTAENNSSINAADGYAGGIAGDNQGDITGCTVTMNGGSITANDAVNYAGGIAGHNKRNITGCTVTMDGSSSITANGTNGCAGGIVGYSFSGSIQDCHGSGGSITADNGKAGDIAGDYTNRTTISSCTWNGAPDDGSNS
ncbi:MAG: bacterial Ig-like domain-containing protein [Candidatus Faecalibacterium intestinavium]|uniref:Bacterial Ig-like domain-containing protein n=1 Tax=Candidatus Faecalibacterium intestinavium TaxID=2838580 RepID=A0A9E2NQG7_9FIRM|nr:bacterial Ig-like domain-containing protein [Candidatus Faecalibacterium intestinavium]